MIPAKVSGWVTAAALLVSVFAAGALAGAAVLELRGPEPEFRGRFGGPDGPGGPGDRRGGARVFRSGGGGPPGVRLAAPPMLPRGMLERLELSEAQRSAVDSVLVHRRAQSDAVLRSMYPLLRAQLDSANAEIRALLTAEQQEIFDRMREEMRQDMRDGPRPGERGPRPPPPGG